MSVLNQEWQERGLYFDFSAASSVFSLDNHGRGHGLSHLLKSVDFVVEWQDQLWLIEVKDPEYTGIPQQLKNRQYVDFMKKLTSQSLIEDELFPKIIDSLLFLGLDRGITNKPLCYMVLIGLSSLEPLHCSTLSDALLGHKGALLKGPPEGWFKGFSVHLFNLELWNRFLPHCPVTRI